jgi:hypothetical protein
VAEQKNYSVTVACVLSQGGKTQYNEGHVRRLKEQVAQHLSLSHDFVCLDDSPYPGYWAKVSLFEPGRFSGRVLYLDLDVTIKGSLDELATFPARFAICKDWTRLGFNSSVMAWEGGTGGTDAIFTDFDYERDSGRFKGDQSWIFHKKPEAQKFPRQWVQSFKIAVMRGGFEPDLRVIAFHGWPKPWEFPDVM